MDKQRKARKRETADVQMDKGEKIWTFEIIKYALYGRIILFYKNYKKINYKNIVKYLLKPGLLM